MEGCDSIVALKLSVAKKPIEYAVYLAVNNPAQGAVSGAGLYASGTQAIITAIPAKGYQFKFWQDSVGTRINENPYSFTVTGNVLWTAAFTRVAKRIAVQSLNAPRRESEIPLCRVFTAEKCVIIENETADMYFLYDAAGRQIASTCGNYQGYLPTGVYLIRLGDEVERFLIH